MRTPEGDQLLGVIRELIHGRVHPSQEEVTVEIVAQALVVIMSDPQYYSHLKLVIDMQSRIIQLEHALASLIQPRPPSMPTKRATATKKVVAKKAAAPRRPTKKPAHSYNVKQFKRGAAGR
jgi:hypothetical protein